MEEYGKWLEVVKSLEVKDLKKEDLKSTSISKRFSSFSTRSLCSKTVKEELKATLS